MLKYRDQQVTMTDLYVILLHTGTAPSLPV